MVAMLSVKSYFSNAYSHIQLNIQLHQAAKAEIKYPESISENQAAPTETRYSHMYARESWTTSEISSERKFTAKKQIDSLFFVCADSKKNEWQTVLAGVLKFNKGRITNPESRCCQETPWESNLLFNIDIIFGALKYCKIQKSATEIKYKWDIMWARIEDRHGKEKVLEITFKPHEKGCPSPKPQRKIQRNWEKVYDWNKHRENLRNDPSYSTIEIPPSVEQKNDDNY